MKIHEALSKIKDEEIYSMTFHLLNKYGYKMKEIPSSASSKYHHGESSESHIEEVLDYIFELAREFNIIGNHLDILISSAILHDISNCIFVTKEYQENQFQRKYNSGYWRSSEGYLYHPTLGSFIIGKYIIEHKNPSWKLIKIAQLIASHMSHWLKQHNPEPKELLEYILCTADYLASRKK